MNSESSEIWQAHRAETSIKFQSDRVTLKPYRVVSDFARIDGKMFLA